MTRTEKQHKLGNAIREYRGLYHQRSKAWIHAPKVHAVARVKRWLVELNLDVAGSMKAIDTFASLDEFKKWMSDLSVP